MDFDHIFVIGIVLLAFAIPSAVSAYSDWRWPKTAIIMALLGAAAIVFVVRENPGEYAINTVDDVIISVVGDIVGN